MIEVQTGARLHFGLLEICHQAPLCFGGLGLMVEQPMFHLRFGLGQNDGQQVHGGEVSQSEELRRRVESVVQHWRESSSSVEPVQWDCVASLPLHTGLGAGTQTACAVALACYLQENSAQADVLSAEWRNVSQLKRFHAQLAKRSKRGLRSAIGLSGFTHGGFILDRGYDPTLGDSERSITTECVSLPAPWTVVLAQPSLSPAVSGAREAKLFQELQQRPNPNREEMLGLSEAVVSAVRENAFAEYCDHLESYMQFAGELFRPVQGGLLNGAAVKQSVRLMNDVGLRAVGQSSWGPTVFGFAKDEAAATAAVERLRELDSSCQWSVVKPLVGGARYRWMNEWKND